MTKKGSSIGRRFSTGDIKVVPLEDGTNTSSLHSSLRGGRVNSGSKHTSPVNTARESISSAQTSIRNKAPTMMMSRANSFQGINQQNSSKKKMKKESVYAFNLSKEQEKLEAELILKKSKNMRKNPGPEARVLKTKFPKTRTSTEIDKMSIITNNIVLGSKRDAADKYKMDNLGITHILNMAQQVPNYHPNDYIYHKISILDAPTTDITDSYAAASSFISRVEKMKGRVLVHCVSGVSRSVSIVIMHFIGKYRMHLKNAYNHIHAVRPYIHPNNGFKYQLAMFELEYLETSSIANNNAGEAWNFYEWNSVKSQYRHQSVDGGEGLDRDICCCIS